MPVGARGAAYLMALIGTMGSGAQSVGDASSARVASARSRFPFSRSASLWIGIGIIAAAFLIRLPNFGNPAYEIDEEFYLLVGDRMLHGMLPYVDIWDRKPIGLFLLYGGIRLLGGDGIVQYQVVATLFAAGTAWLIHHIARPVAGRFGATVAALAYLLWIETVEGGGGQAPIFYNLLVAGTAACTLRAMATTDSTRFRQLAFFGMVLGGIAIQIKYTAVFEVAYFGALLAWYTQRHNRRLTAALTETATLALTALAPTIAAIAFYGSIGQFQTFWFANFQSVFQRSASDPGELHLALIEMVKHLAPLSVCFGASLWQLGFGARAEGRRWHWVVSGWLIAAFGGYVSVGALFYHYMLPLFVPLAIAAAPIFRRWPVGMVMAGITMWIPFSNLGYPDFATTRYASERITAIQRLIPKEVDQRCMQMFAGPPILYLRTHACFVTPYVFPDHLVARIETRAIGTDPRVELRRLVARRPLALIINDADYRLDPVSFNLLKALRGRFYQRVGSVEFNGRQIDVWVLNADPPTRLSAKPVARSS